MAPKLSAARSSETEAIRWLMAAVADLPLTVEPVGRGSRPAADVVLKLGDQQHYLQLKSARGGWPSSIRDVISRPEFSPEHTVLFAPMFSPGAIDLMTKVRLNWVDSLGNLRLTQWPALVIERLRVRDRPAIARGFGWSPSAEDIAEWVLTHGGRRFSVAEIVADREWSNPQTSRTLTRFDELGWTKRTGGLRGRGIWREHGTDRGALLDSWTEHVAGRAYPTRRLHALSKDLIESVAEALAGVMDTNTSAWAFTGLAGAQILRPMLTSVPSVDVAISESSFDDDRVWRNLSERGLRPAGEGGSITVLRMGGRPLSYVTVERGLPVLSAPRVYASIAGSNGRATEVAQDIRDGLIGF